MLNLNNIEKANEKYSDDMYEIWEACFGDEIGYIEFCLDRYIEDFYIYKQDNRAVAMLAVIECEYKDSNIKKVYKGGYIYAVATLPKYTNKGISKFLLSGVERELKEKNYDFVCLVPSSENLYGFYSNQGYIEGVYNQQESLLIDDIIKNKKELESSYILKNLDFTTYEKYRYKYMPINSINWKKQHLEYLYKENEYIGGKCVACLENNSICGVAMIVDNGDEVFVKEVIPHEYSKNIVAKIMIEYGKKVVYRTTPQKNKKEKFGMYKSFVDMRLKDNCYISLVLD